MSDEEGPRSPSDDGGNPRGGTPPATAVNLDRLLEALGGFGRFQKGWYVGVNIPISLFVSGLS